MSRFLERWSRLKKAAETASTADGIDPQKLLAELGPDSDFTVFLKEEVSEAVRRQAMKTLFADPHFNVMDGLDIYIDDYSISDPIPDEMMATLHQMRSIVEEPQSAEPAAESAEVPAAASAEAAENGDILSADGQNVPPLEAAGNSPSVNQ
ncbi:MAG: DUF3306 domain-containing protein [Rhodocyclaceae bacterium]|nr:DUF3306 domain-containing protein [Rhodocyclaceae bacterium]